MLHLESLLHLGPSVVTLLKHVRGRADRLKICAYADRGAQSCQFQYTRHIIIEFVPFWPFIIYAHYSLQNLALICAFFYC